MKLLQWLRDYESISYRSQCLETSWTRENVIVNISILYRLREREERKRRGKLDLPYSPYWHTRRLRFTAIFSDFAYRSQTCVCAYIIGLGKKREGRRKRNPIGVLSSPALPELLQAHSPFPHRFTYIRQSQTFLRAQFIAERPSLPHRYKACWCARRIPSFGSNCHNWITKEISELRFDYECAHVTLATTSYRGRFI